VGAWVAPSGAPACRVPPRAPPRLGARGSCRAAAGVAATSLHAATHSHGAAGAWVAPPAARAGAAEDPCCAGAGVSSCLFLSDSFVVVVPLPHHPDPGSLELGVIVKPSLGPAQNA